MALAPEIAEIVDVALLNIPLQLGAGLDNLQLVKTLAGGDEPTLATADALLTDCAARIALIQG